MSRSAYILVIVVLVIATALLTIRLLSSGYMPVLDPMFWGLAGLVLLADFFAVIKRWMPFSFYKRERAKMEFDEVVNLKYMPRKRIKLVITVFLFSLFGLVFASFTFSVFLGMALWFVALELMVYYSLYSGLKRFRIGITEHVLFALAPDLVATNWETIKMIDRKYDDLYFTMKNGAVKVLPINGLEEDARKKLMSLLITRADKHGFHVTNAVENDH